MNLRAEHLAALNLVLDANPDLKAVIEQKLTLVFVLLDKGADPKARLAALDQLWENTMLVRGITAPSTPEAPPEAPSQADELEPKILGWFQAHTGKHRLAEVRKDLDVPQTSKPFKTALARLLNSKQVEWSEKRGVAAEYWLGKGK